MAAKAKRVGERDLLRNVRQGLGHDIDSALRIGLGKPRRRRHAIASDRKRTDDGFDRTGRAERVARRALDGRHRNARGKLIVIDGGFCKAYQPTTGIAGYTLIYNSWVLRIVSHEPFCGRKTAIEKNVDIANSSRVFERMDTRIKIAQTDIGAKLQAQADALRDLLSAYKAGAVPEDHRE